MLGLTFSSKLDLGSSIISVAKTASKKIEALFRSINFLSPEVALYTCKSTIHPCMEYCFHVRAGASSFWNCKISYKNRFTGLSILCLLHPYEPLAHLGNVASLSIFCRYCFGRCSSELAQHASTSFFLREVCSSF